MFSLNETMRYHLCPGRTDMRKGINSLIGVVREKMGAESGTATCSSSSAAAGGS